MSRTHSSSLSLSRSVSPFLPSPRRIIPAFRSCVAFESYNFCDYEYILDSHELFCSWRLNAKARSLLLQLSLSFFSQVYEDIASNVASESSRGTLLQSTPLSLVFHRFVPIDSFFLVSNISITLLCYCFFIDFNLVQLAGIWSVDYYHNRFIGEPSSITHRRNTRWSFKFCVSGVKLIFSRLKQQKFSL